MTIVVPVAAIIAVLTRRLAPILFPARFRAGRLGERNRRRGAFDELVKFAPVQPDAPAFRAVVDLDPLPVHHLKLGVVHRALHRLVSCHAIPSDMGTTRPAVQPGRAEKRVSARRMSGRMPDTLPYACHTPRAARQTPFR